MASPTAAIATLEPAIGGVAAGGLAGAVQARHVDELVAHPHLRVQAALLGHVADPPPLLGADRGTAPAHRAGVSGEDAEDDPHRRRLAGAVGAEHLSLGTAKETPSRATVSP
jgi:hypothetical protein